MSKVQLAYASNVKPRAVAHELIVLEEASRALERMSIKETVEFRNKAEALRVWARAANKELEIQNQIAVHRIRAERKVGRYLASRHLRGGDRRSKHRDGPTELQRLEITKDQSKRYQRLAQVPDEIFDKYIDEVIESRSEITSAGLIRKGNGQKKTPNRQGIGDKRRDEKNLIAEPADLLEELENHRALLVEILCPVYEGQGDDIKLAGGEWRVVGQLLREMGQILKRLVKLQEREAVLDRAPLEQRGSVPL